MKKLSLLTVIIAWYFFIVIIFFFTGFVLEGTVDPTGTKGWMWANEKNPKIYGLTVKQFVQKIKDWIDEFATEYEFAIIWFFFSLYDPIYMPFFWSLFCVCFELYKEFSEPVVEKLNMIFEFLLTPEQIAKLRDVEDLAKEAKEMEDFIKSDKSEMAEKTLRPGVVRKPR